MAKGPVEIVLYNPCDSSLTDTNIFGAFRLVDALTVTNTAMG